MFKKYEIWGYYQIPGNIVRRDFKLIFRVLCKHWRIKPVLMPTLRGLNFHISERKKVTGVGRCEWGLSLIGDLVVASLSGISFRSSLGDEGKGVTEGSGMCVEGCSTITNSNIKHSSSTYSTLCYCIPASPNATAARTV